MASTAPSKDFSPVIRMKMRTDLTADLITYQGIEYWVIKEPLGQKYYQFPPHVYYLLTQLNGHRTIEDLIEGFHREHAPKRITRSELQQLLTRFHRDGLVISAVSGQGKELLKRGRKNAAMEKVTSLSNILAVRWRGFDPERILNFLDRWVWWLFTPTAIVLTLMTAMIALTSVMIHFEEFQSRLPGFDQFFDPRRWLMFAGVLAVTKMLHEFGHGLSCKRLGGECHEIGFMLLVLTPCLYCNVSDSWRLPNKWHRAAIGAAGMYVEVILATIATFVWWYVEPGWIQDLCLQVMLVSSVSTVLFNGNPLLRFDGYYILSDLLEIPNMYQKSTKALTTLLGRHWLGLEIPDDQLMPTNRPWAFALYTVAAFCYRWFILASIIIFLTRWLEPYGLDSVGKGIAIFAAGGMLFWPGYKLFRYMSVPGRMHQIEKPRFAIISLIGALLISAILFIPFPHELRCSLVMVPQSMETIYVEEPGLVNAVAVKSGDVVEPGATLATLENLDYSLALEEARGHLQDKIAEKKILQSSAANAQFANLLDQVASVEAEIRNLKRFVQDVENRMKKLEIRSTIAGTVLETPYIPAGPQSEDLPLLDRQSFLSGRNENLSAQRGQRFCEVADLTRWHAIVLLTEDQVNLARTGQDVRIRLYSNPGQTVYSSIESLGDADQSIRRDKKNAASIMNTQAQQKSDGLPDLITEMVAANFHSDIQYFARVPIDPNQSELKIGLGGQARLDAGNRSLGARLWRWFNQNFRT